MNARVFVCIHVCMQCETEPSLQEPVAFLVQCFLRSQAAPKAEWAQDVWSGICVCARETTVSLTMEQLVQGRLQAWQGHPTRVHACVSECMRMCV